MAIQGMKALISAQTDAASVDCEVPANTRLTITAGKLAGAETVDFKLLEDGVASPGDLYQDGSQKQLTATHNATLIEGPIVLRISKTATASAVGVYARG